ncbi:MAG TPA: hypothetical protein PKD67_00360 [Ignavibacteriaceae bacterium]|nr:hypothetical protein [Ignavibacteriaceae bacterium]
MNDQVKNNSKFKYNVSFYYQSTIIYFIVFAVYLIIRGQFIEDSYMLITKDPIIYLLAFIVIVSLFSLLYNLIRNRYIEFNNDGIAFCDKFKSRLISKSDIAEIKLSKDRRYQKSNILKFVRLKLKSRRRPIIIRPSDYENENELIKKFHQLKIEIESL